MDNQSDYVVSSREEYIRLARESCLKNLGSKAHEIDISKKSNAGLVSSPYQYDKMEYGSNTPLVHGGIFNISQPRLKQLLIRAICALVLFLTIFLIDKFNITYKNINSSSIETMVSSNKGFDKAEEYVLNLISKFAKEDNTTNSE